MLRIAPLIALAVACLLAIAACGGDDSTPSDLGNGPANDVNGTWEGDYTSATGATGHFCLDIEQDNRTIGGKVAFDGGPPAQISGAIATNRLVFNWGQLAAASATSAVPTNIAASGTFSGTAEAGTFTGTYTVTVTGDHGDWTGHLSTLDDCG
ncbi:MAG: hypothetical protein ABI559_12020 [Chloroflexota bacterium]